MRAMQLEKPSPVNQSPLRLTELPVPFPGDKEIRVRITVCGVCHTDLHIVEGELPLPLLPVVPGHQVVGIVDALGTGEAVFRLGDRVGIPWLYSTCGECTYCRKGLENLCENARFTGLHVDGGYAEWMLVHQDFAYHLPVRFSDCQAAPLLCAGVIGYRALSLCGVRAGERLGLYGFGASAHIVLQLARHLHCEVYVFTRSADHRRLAEQLGARWTGSAQDTPPAPMDGSILFAPAGALVLDALRVLRPGGTLALAGITMSPIPQTDYDLIYHERVLRSVANSTRDDVRNLLRLAAEIPIRTEIELFPLADANRALQLLKTSEIRGAAVLQIEA
jgi:alcohol dehydrogenase, propanol-preferring